MTLSRTWQIAYSFATLFWFLVGCALGHHFGERTGLATAEESEKVSRASQAALMHEVGICLWTEMAPTYFGCVRDEP